jgi:hypothetical protein
MPDAVGYWHNGLKNLLTMVDYIWTALKSFLTAAYSMMWTIRNRRCGNANLIALSCCDFKSKLLITFKLIRATAIITLCGEFPSHGHLLWRFQNSKAKKQHKHRSTNIEHGWMSTTNVWSNCTKFCKINLWRSILKHILRMRSKKQWTHWSWRIWNS